VRNRKNKILFPAIDLKDGCPHCPQQVQIFLGGEDMQLKESIRHA